MGGYVLHICNNYLLMSNNHLLDNGVHELVSTCVCPCSAPPPGLPQGLEHVRLPLPSPPPGLPQVLEHVRLPLLSPKFLVGTVGSDLLIKSDEACRDLVDEAKNYLLLPQERPLMQGPRTRPRKPIKTGEVLFAGKPTAQLLLSPFSSLVLHR